MAGGSIGLYELLRVPRAPRDDIQMRILTVWYGRM